MRLRSICSDHNSTSSSRRGRRLALALALASGLVGMADAQTTSLPQLTDLAKETSSDESCLLPYPFAKPSSSSPSGPAICPADANNCSPGQRLVALLGLNSGHSQTTGSPTSSAVIEPFDSIVMCQATNPTLPDMGPTLPVVQAAASMPDTLTNSTSHEDRQPSLIEIDVPEYNVPEYNVPENDVPEKNGPVNDVEASLELQLPDEVLVPAMGVSEPDMIAAPSTGRQPQILPAKKPLRITLEAPALPPASMPTASLATDSLPARAPAKPSVLKPSEESKEIAKPVSKDGLVQAATPIRAAAAESTATNLNFSDHAATPATLADFNINDNLNEGPQRSSLHMSSSSAKRVQASKLAQPLEPFQPSVDSQTASDTRPDIVSSRLTDEAPQQTAPPPGNRLPPLQPLSADHGSIASAQDAASEATHGIHLQISGDDSYELNDSHVVNAVELQHERKTRAQPLGAPPATKREPQVARGMQIHISGEPVHIISTPATRPVLVEAVQPPVFTDPNWASTVRKPQKLAASQSPSSQPSKLAPASPQNTKQGKALSVELQDCINLPVEALISELSVEQPGICQLLKTGDRTLSIIGLQPGSTRIAIVTRNPSGEAEVELREVTVTSQAAVDAGLAQYATVMSQAIARLYPKNDIQVIAGEEKLIVRGTVGSESDAKKILSLVRKTSLTPVVDELQSPGR